MLGGGEVAAGGAGRVAVLCQVRRTEETDVSTRNQILRITLPLRFKQCKCRCSASKSANDAVAHASCTLHRYSKPSMMTVIISGKLLKWRRYRAGLLRFGGGCVRGAAGARGRATHGSITTT